MRGIQKRESFVERGNLFRSAQDANAFFKNPLGPLAVVRFAKRIDFQIWILDCCQKVGAGIFKMRGLFRDGELDSVGVFGGGEADVSVMVRLDKESSGTAIECGAIGG